MKKYMIIICVISISSSCFLHGQEKLSKWNYELSTGVSLLGAGDVTAINIENGVSYSLNSLIETSLSVLYGRGIVNYKHFSSSYINGNINIMLAPLRNKYKYSLKLGGGLSFGNRNRVSSKVGHWVNNNFVVLEYYFVNQNEIGYNLIIENSYKVSKRSYVSLKIFMQRYGSRETNFGTMIKIGYQL